MALHYMYQQGNWSPIQNPTKGIALDKLSFETSRPFAEKLIAHGIDLDLYARKEFQTQFPFKFYAKLSISTTECFVWMPDLPDVFALLKELDASPQAPRLDALVEQAIQVLGELLTEDLTIRTSSRD